MQQRILIVDDDELNVDILRKILSVDYEVSSATTGEECMDALKTFGPDLILLDIMMPGMDGYETCRRIKAEPGGSLTQVMLVSGKASPKERLQGYDAGADDYVIKPFNHDELLARVCILFRLRHSTMELAHANAQIQTYNAELEEVVTRRTAQIIETQAITVFALAKLAESRDPDTGAHLERMRSYSQILAEQLAREGPYVRQVTKRFLVDLYQSSPLHDIGKVGISDSVLQKPGKLTKSEFELMKRHTIIGAEALEKAAAHTDSGGFLNMAARIARCHHERFNGTGYPLGLAGEDIPLEARIVAVADVFDALTSVRVYKTAFDPEVAKSMIEDEAGAHFDPHIVTAFQTCYEEFLGIHAQARRSNETIEEQPCVANA